MASVIDYYLDKLALQYRDKPKARATISAVGQALIADNLPAQILTAFDVNTAVGAQLDVLGRIVGVSRNIGLSNLPGLFSVWDYEAAELDENYQGTWDPATNVPAIPAAAPGNANFWYVASASGTSTAPITSTFKCGDLLVSDGTAWAKAVDQSGNGLTDYADPAVNANGVFYDYADASRQFAALSDDSYRTVIKLKIILNSSDGTQASVVAALARIFPGLITVVDNLDMTITYYVVSTVPLAPEILEVFLPQPMGVGVSIVITNPIPATGGDLETEDGFTITTEDGTPLSTETT